MVLSSEMWQKCGSESRELRPILRDFGTLLVYFAPFFKVKKFWRAMVERGYAR
jgi:hypothetical protein